jgi:hypothetical protein
VVDLEDLPQGLAERLWAAIILVFWCLWRPKDDMVFDRASPAVDAIKTRIREEYKQWHLAKLFRLGDFSFPEPVPIWWHEGE